MLTLTRQEQTRERNRLAFANEMCLEDHEKRMLSFAPNYNFPYDDPAVLASVQAVVDGAERGGFVRYGLRWTDAIGAAIAAGVIKRPHRSYSGKPNVAALYLGPPAKTT
jgi:hypothetical protein